MVGGIVSFFGGFKGWLLGGVEDIVVLLGVFGVVGRQGFGVGWWELRRWGAGFWCWLVVVFRVFCWIFGVKVKIDKIYVKTSFTKAAETAKIMG